MNNQAIQDAINTWALNYEPRPKNYGTTSRVDVGKALKTIRDKRLHREKAADFYVYCAGRFGLSPQSVESYIAAFENHRIVIPELKTEDERYVYFIEGAGLIKIGVTDDVSKRFSSIRNMSPVPLALLGFISGNRKTEIELHQRFAQYRRHGEWFEASAELKIFIQENVKK